MLHQNIKEKTTASHQQLEKIVVHQLKAVRSNADYADVLRNFYAYFSTVEKTIAPFITPQVLPDYADRRNSSHIRQDIEALGGNLDNLPQACAPEVTNTLEALAALYVLEGSIMGGPYIVQMLHKYGVTEGTSFFSGYAEDTGRMWSAFTSVLNQFGQDPETHQKAIAIANETFANFGNVFTAVPAER